MQRTFLSNLFWLILLNLLIKPIWVLGIDVKVQNTLGPQVYGDFFSLLNFAFLFTVVLDFGLNNYNNRKISQDPGVLKSTIAESALVKFFLALVFSGVVLAAAYVVSYSSAEIELLKYISLMLFLQSFLIFLRSNISGMQWYKADVFLSVLDKSLMILLIGFMLFSSFLEEGFSVIHFILGQCIAYVIAIVIAMVLIALKVKKIEVDLKASRIMTIMKESAPFALLTFLMLIYFKVDVVMIERMLPDGDLQAGYYAQAYKLLEAAVMFAFLFSSLLLPMFSRMLAASEKVEDLVRLSSKLLLAPAFILVVSLVFYGEELMRSMFDSGAENAALIFPLLMATFLPMASNYIFGTLITAEGNLSYLNKLSAVAIVVNIVMNYILIPRIGIMGATISTLFTQTFVAMLQWYAATSSQAIFYSNLIIKRTLLFIVSIMVLSILIYMININWMLKLSLNLAGGICVAMLMKIISLDAMKKILQTPE